MGRCEALFKQKPHRVAFITKAWLHADKDIAEALAEHMDRRAVRLHAAGGRAPLRFNRSEMGFTTNVIINRNARMNIGERAIITGIAVQNAVAQGINRCRQIN